METGHRTQMRTGSGVNKKEKKTLLQKLRHSSRFIDMRGGKQTKHRWNTLEEKRGSREVTQEGRDGAG